MYGSRGDCDSVLETYIVCDLSRGEYNFMEFVYVHVVLSYHNNVYSWIQ